LKKNSNFGIKKDIFLIIKPANNKLKISRNLKKNSKSGVFIRKMIFINLKKVMSICQFYSIFQILKFKNVT
jgi:hypothetical protein